MAIFPFFLSMCEFMRRNKQEAGISEAASFPSWIGRFACLIGTWQPAVTGSITRRLQQSAVGA